MKRVITINSADIKKLTRYYHKQCFDSFDDRDQWIKKQTKTLPKSETLGIGGELYQIFKEELISLPHNLFQDIEKEETLPIPFYEARIVLIPKERYHKKGKLYTNIPYQYTCENI